MLGEEHRIGEQVHVLVRYEDGGTGCATGWITGWDDTSQTATAFGLPATEGGGGLTDSMAMGWDLKHDDSGKEPPPAEDRRVISFHTPRMCPWRR